MMKHLFTNCPRCRAHFYVSEENRVGGKVKVTCPYCYLNYRDVWDPTRVREAKYNWELYNNIYSSISFSHGNESHLKIGGLFLFLSFTLFVLGAFSVFIVNGFILINWAVGLGGMIYSLFVFLGAFNAYKARSFVISLTGSIFALLGSFLWGGLNTGVDYILFKSSISVVYLFITILFSLIALILIVRNREKFSFGY